MQGQGIDTDCMSVQVCVYVCVYVRVSGASDLNMWMDELGMYVHALVCITL